MKIKKEIKETCSIRLKPSLKKEILKNFESLSFAIEYIIQKYIDEKNKEVK